MEHSVRLPLARRLGRRTYLTLCGAGFVFLIAPILVIVPLSFNAEPYFTFTEGMLRLDPEAWSLRWYDAILAPEERLGRSARQQPSHRRCGNGHCDSARHHRRPWPSKRGDALPPPGHGPCCFRRW